MIKAGAHRGFWKAFEDHEKPRSQDGFQLLCRQALDLFENGNEEIACYEEDTKTARAEARFAA